MVNFGNMSIADLRLGTVQVKAAYLDSEQVWGGWLCFTAEQANSTVRLNKNGSPNAISLETSTDGSTWTDYSWTSTNGDIVTLANVGDKVYFRAKTENSTLGSSVSNYYKFVMSNKIAASGNIQTLLKADGSRTNAPAYCYDHLFYDCASLTTAPALPAKTLATRCYGSMFQNCTSLTSTPALPATTLASSCYTSMFQGCTSLTTALELPATTLANSCYSNMFQDCTSLTAAPALPAMTLANSCYQSMFSGCTSLTTAPATLPATTLANYCYDSMFIGCTSLTTAPALPATKLTTRCYNGMFNGCTSLTGNTTVSLVQTSAIPNNALYQTFAGITGQAQLTFVLDMSDFRAIPQLQNANTISVFNSTTDTRMTIKVPASLLTKWKQSSNWSSFADRIVAA